MPAALTFSVLDLLMLLQGSGCLLLALVAGALCLPRRRQPACCWAAAWAGQGGALLAAGSATTPLAPVLAAWSAYFWALGAWLYLRQPGQSDTDGEPQPLPALSHLALGFVLLGVLGGGIASLIPEVASLRIPLLLIALGQALASLILMRRSRGDSDRGVQATVLALLVSAGLSLIQPLSSDRLPLPALLGLAGWAGLAVATVFFLVNEEQARLREAYRKQEEHEERFRLIFEHSGVGMALMRPDGRVIQVNPSLTAMLGYEAEELKDRRLSDLIATEDRTSEIQLARTQDTPSLYEREKRYVHKSGEIVWAKVLRVPIRDASGQPRYYVGVLVNITARRKAEEALSDSEKRYRLLHQVANDGIYVTGETGEILDVNPAFTRMLGLTRNDLIGKPLSEFAAEPEALRRHLREVLDRGNSRLETQLCRRDGQKVEVETSAALLELEGRRLIHGICRDVTERKQADRELRQTQQRLREERDFTRQILETADALILVVDVTGRIVRFNGACVQASGYREEDVLGRVFWEALFPERSRNLVRDSFERALVSTPSPARTPLPAPSRRGSEARRAALLADEIPWRICSGQERLVAWRHSVVRDTEGACKYVIFTGIDITEQRRLEEEVRQARKLETLGTLVGGIAHDFNNHLTVILGNLSLGLSDLLALERTGVTIPPSALRELRLQLEQVDAAAQRCADVTRRLLTFSKGRTSPVQPTPLLPLLEEAVAGLRGQTHDSLEVRLEGEPGLWAVLGDASQLQQVLSILVSNARDAMPGGGTLTLRACNRTLSEDEPLPHPEAHPGSYVELTVRDTGKGMPPEVRERLFEPFFTTKEIGKGTGMGLAMVYGIVKAHKGWITVESVPERGSAFTLYFPAAPSLTPVESRASPALTATACVLVVDDEDQVRNLARLILERAGYRVLDAANGEAAVELHAQRASEIDLVLMDYAMPRMNGLEAFQRMRQRTPNLRVIFSSGYTMDVDGEQLLQAGARGFVPKPYRPDALVRLVREVLASSESG